MTLGKNYDVLKISGDPFERGKEYGKIKQNDISHLVEYLYDLFNKSKASREEALKYVQKHIPYIEEYSPEIKEELKGIAEGANLLYEEIIMIHMHEERAGFSSHNCTTFAATGSSTTDGDTFIGQTWDISKNLCENAGAFLLKTKRENGPDTLAYTYAGMLAGAGINSEGISIVWNSVPRLGLKPGVPTYIIIAEILRQKRIGDAIAAILKADRAGCFNFLIADESELYNIEATPDDVHISYSNKYLSHANHYLSEKFRNKQDIVKVARNYSASTIIRNNRINRMLKENDGNINLEACQEFMKDHVNYPESICRHPDPEKDKDKRLITCSSFVIVPSKKELYISNGPACQNKYFNYKIEE